MHVVGAGARAVHVAEAEEGAKVAHVERVHCEKGAGLVVGVRPDQSVVQHRAGAELRGPAAAAAAAVKGTRIKEKKGREAPSPAAAWTRTNILHDAVF